MYDKAKLIEGLNKLTGIDYEAAKRRFRTVNPDFFGVLNIESTFQLELASMALNVNANELKSLPVKEYVQVCNTVQRFLSDTLEEETATKS